MRPAIQLRQQIFLRCSDDIHQLAVQGFFIAESFRVGHRSGSQVRIAAALDRVAAQICSRIVHDFLAQSLVNLHGRAANLN